MTNNYRILDGWVIFDKPGASLCLSLQDVGTGYQVGHIEGKPLWKGTLEQFLNDGIINNLEYVDLFNYIERYIKSKGIPIFPHA